jgi:hypothetical protein
MYFTRNKKLLKKWDSKTNPLGGIGAVSIKPTRLKGIGWLSKHKGLKRFSVMWIAINDSRYHKSDRRCK